MFGNLQYLDAQLLIAVRSLAIPHPDLAKVFVRLFADIEVFATVVLLVAFWLRARFLAKTSEKEIALRMFYVIAWAFGVYLLLNQFLPIRPRPETVTAIAPLIAHLPDNSFPSGHAIFSGASVVAIAIFADSCVLTSSFALLALIMCFARVLAGVHYPGDILAGLIIGTIFALIFASVVKKMKSEHPAFVIPVKLASIIGL